MKPFHRYRMIIRNFPLGKGKKSFFSQDTFVSGRTWLPESRLRHNRSNGLSRIIVGIAWSVAVSVQRIRSVCRENRCRHESMMRWPQVPESTLDDACSPDFLRPRRITCQGTVHVGLATGFIDSPELNCDATASIFGSAQFRACSCSKAGASSFRNALWHEIHFEEWRNRPLDTRLSRGHRGLLGIRVRT